jgi:transcriptional regulator with XRE-family HTH domain
MTRIISERPAPDTVWAALNHQRQLARLSLRGCARSAGISASYLSLIEHGKRNPSADVVVRVCGATARAYR